MKRKEKKSSVPFKFSMPKRLLAAFCACVLVPYALGMSFAVHMAQNAIPEAEKTYESRVTALAEQLDTELSRIESQLYYNLRRTPVQYLSIVTPSFTFAELYAHIMDTQEIIYSLRNASGLLDKTTVYFPGINEKIASDGSFLPLTEKDLAFIELYKKNLGKGTLAAVNGALCMASDTMHLSGASSKANIDGAAVLRLDFSDKTMEQLCDVFPEESRVGLFCPAWEGDDYFISVGSDMYDADDVRGDLIEAAEQTAKSGEPLTGSVKLKGQQTLRIVCRVGRRSLWIGGYIDARVLQNATSSFTMWQLVLTAFLLLEIVFFFYLMRKMVAKPVNRFANEVKRLETEGMIQLTDEPRNDMDFLYEAFMGMSEKLKAELEESYKNKVLVYQSEIKYLQAQVNPHFLYNSFYHLYRMAKMEDNEGVAEMSSRLSSYYRYITRADQNEVPLEMEYNNIVDYTEIQTIRFGNRIHVELEPMPESYRTLTVPRFVLQPLFENAYYHGVEKIAKGRIRLQFKSRPGALVITVENNGACTDEELDSLTKYLDKQTPGEKITALKNVKGRMQLLGGDMSVSRGTLGGFCVALTLPVREEKKKDANPADCG